METWPSACFACSRSCMVLVYAAAKDRDCRGQTDGVTDLAADFFGGMQKKLSYIP